MQFNTPLIEAKFIKRYKRFFVDAALPNGQVVTAHCANTGSMLGLIEEGATVWLSETDNPKRKLRYTLEIVQTPTSLVGVHTGRPNKLVQEAIASGELEEFQNIATIKPEQKYGQNSRIDLLIEQTDGPPLYLEVKNVTLQQNNVALFPDSVTSRGAKHLAELSAEVEKGNRAMMFYLVQRGDCEHFSPAVDIDPHYTAELKKAIASGVEAIAYECTITPNEIRLSKRLPIVI